ncbi:hypothetical protein [Acidisphaera sp. L21]|uniref:hypothetical protein n=1 Tax=Acidisphaera sp. L21 TaxID=1641851 RepID=UPI001C208CA7|nr:hypothetical protein [Acidisphaera sp. L21]
MKRPPAVVVHGLSHLKQAIEPGLPVTLLSGAGAATYAGCGWWRALMALGAGENPDILDCGDAPGRAMEALRAGCRLVLLDPAVPAWGLVAARAAAAGARLLADRPPALDLGKPGAQRRLRAWLEGDSTGPVG